MLVSGRVKPFPGSWKRTGFESLIPCEFESTKPQAETGHGLTSDWWLLKDMERLHARNLEKNWKHPAPKSFSLNDLSYYDLGKWIKSYFPKHPSGKSYFKIPIVLFSQFRPLLNINSLKIWKLQGVNFWHKKLLQNTP